MLHLPAESLTDNHTPKKIVLVLFHNDLRVNDNATLEHAATLASSNQGRLLLLYASSLTNTDKQKTWSKAYHFDEMGFARQRFLAESLADLDESLHHPYLLRCPLKIYPKVLLNFVNRLNQIMIY